jgi:hypothetical protein
MKMIPKRDALAQERPALAGTFQIQEDGPSTMGDGRRAGEAQNVIN